MIPTFSVTKYDILLAFFIIASTSTGLVSGAPNPTKNARIIGGVNATVGEFPFMVSLQMKPLSGESYHFCAGVIIGDGRTPTNLVMTAGHCLYGRDPTQIQVVAGAHNLSDPSEQFLQIRNISYVNIHPDFDPVTLSNDYGAIFVDPPFLRNSRVQHSPIHLSWTPPEYSENCTHIGWGSSLNSSSPPPVFPQLLKKVNLTFVDDSTCEETYQHLKPINSTTMKCAAGGSQGPCTGDAGGPLLCHETISNRNVVVGTLSYGMTPCGSYPFVFMDFYALGWYT